MAGRGVLGSGRWAPGGHVGEEGEGGGRRGRACSSRGSPLPAPGKPEPRRAAADPALATGEELSHLPQPALCSRKGGGVPQRRSGSESDRFSLRFYM